MPLKTSHQQNTTVHSWYSTPFQIIILRQNITTGYYTGQEIFKARRWTHVKCMVIRWLLCFNDKLMILIKRLQKPKEQIIRGLIFNFTTKISAILCAVMSLKMKGIQLKSNQSTQGLITHRIYCGKLIKVNIRQWKSWWGGVCYLTLCLITRKGY